MAKEKDVQEMFRFQGDVRTYEKVLGLPADLGRNPQRVVPQGR